MMGRPAKQDVIRDSSGKSRGERPISIMATALASRARDMGIKAKFDFDDHGTIVGMTGAHDLVVRNERGAIIGTDAASGFTLGRLRQWGMPSGISLDNFNTGENYAKLVRKWQSIMGLPAGSPKALGFELTGNGSVCRPDPDDELVLKTRAKYRDCYGILMNAGLDMKKHKHDGRRYDGTEIAVWTYDACLDRVPFKSFGEAEVGFVRLGLNALARELR